MIRQIGTIWLVLLLMLLGRPAGAAEAVGVTEHLGAKVPLDLVLTDADGRPVRLGDLLTVPTVILPVYYNCTNVCFALQGRMANALNKLERQPLGDYRVISVSFDETETPAVAQRSRKLYLGAIKRDFPPEAWQFLTGDRAAIQRLTDALGFHVQRQGVDFLHPVASIVVTADGTIVRYLYGTTVLPKDLALALVEAKQGIGGASIRKVMEYCFTYDPANKTYVFNLLRVSATVVILCTGAFLAYLLLSGRKRRNQPPR